MAAAGEQYLGEGLTSVTEAGVGGGWIGQSPVELAAYVAAREQGRLHVRAELMVISDAFHPLARTRPTASRPASTWGCAPASATTGCGSAR